MLWNADWCLRSDVVGQSTWVQGGTISGYFVNIKIPFGRSVEVTVKGVIRNGFVIVRGCENLPVAVGALTLPASARLTLQKIENRVFNSLDFVRHFPARFLCHFNGVTLAVCAHG